MQKQLGKSVALYYRVATRVSSGQHLDNQMQRLLCYTRENSLDNFILYTDCGASGLTLDRPALNVLKTDIKVGRVDRVIVFDLMRISRNYVSTCDFIRWAHTYGVSIISITDGYRSFPFEEGSEVA
ncbi:MAG: recombinase family protein [Coriobacteriales bacterium]|nr:recombinase family protein [Coriobacteriales bacterium]